MPAVIRLAGTHRAEPGRRGQGGRYEAERSHNALLGPPVARNVGRRIGCGPAEILATRGRSNPSLSAFSPIISHQSSAHSRPLPTNSRLLSIRMN